MALALVVCDWYSCVKEDIRDDGLEKGQLEITVNGKAVTSWENLGDEFLILEGEHGKYWKSSSEGGYEVKFVVKESDRYFRISAIILY